MKANLAPASSASSADWLARGFPGPPLLVSTFVPEIFPAVARVLNPGKCFSAAWSGYSDIRDEFAGAPVVILPSEREIYLLEGPVEAATEEFDE